MPKGEQLVYFRPSLFALVVLVEIVVTFPSQGSSSAMFRDYTSTVLSMAPKGWTFAEKRLDAVPEGFYNKETEGQLYIFCGPNSVGWNWKDATGNWHREALAKESLEIWVFPGDYRPGLRTYLTIKGPILPSKVYASPTIVVYAKPSHWLAVSGREFKNLVSKATSMYWDDSGGKHAISWNNWRIDIATAFKTADRLK